MAHLAREALGDRMLAVVVASPLQPPRELTRAISVAKRLDLPLEIAEADEISLPGFEDNPPERCYLCKKLRLELLRGMADRRGYEAILEGSNLDDASSHRPGMRASLELGALSPLEKAGLRKAEVRAAARELGLPNWDALLTRNPAYARIFPPKPFDPFLTPGDTLVFRLRANAAVKRAGKRYALKSREEKLDWLGRHLEAGGCSVLASDILEDTFIHASRGDDALSVQATLFQGRLRVQDPAKARAMVEKGIGPAKALGLGLLSLCRR